MNRLVTIALLILLTAVPSLGANKVKLNGYAEYRQGDILIVEGQRVQVQPGTKFKGKGIRSLSNIVLGYEVKVNGERLSDGRVLAKKIEAKPNGNALFEADVLAATNEIEKMWTERGKMYYPLSDGGEKEIGKIYESGPRVQRVRRIMSRLVPPYIDPNQLRVRVVETDEWNASAMGNGAIWVYSGLIDEMNDDELAIILGHELAHYSHEHSRNGAKQAMIAQLIGVAGVVTAATTTSGATTQAAQLGTMLGLTAYQNGYGREFEDQADQVGLRYAYEGGFDVYQGPRLWRRFREKYGEPDSVTNFFFGSHSRPSNRIASLEREIELNYKGDGRNTRNTRD